MGKKFTFLIVFWLGLFSGLALSAEEKKVQAGPKEPVHWITADHSKHKILNQDFKTPEEVIAACLSCHNEAAKQMQKTIHWTWLCPYDPEKKMGKGGLTFNNYCISIWSNEPRCTSCHAGFGWKDRHFDFSRQDKVDCLVCHDQTGTYKKFPTLAGYPVSEPKKFGQKTFYPPDYKTIAQSVGRPTRYNCGTCHFFGGGGDGVKHGDLDSSMFNPSRDLDVHMSPKGANFTCVRCHSTEAHKIAGRCYKQPAFRERKSLLEDDQIKRIACESCHSATLHKNMAKLNDHTDKVACQSCHIPTFARKLPTKMYWDWSKAGKLKNGKPYSVEDELGKHKYNSLKGEFVWKKNVVPEYLWFNGSMDYILLTDKVDPQKQPIKINRVIGSKDDPKSRIYPFKVHRGKQPFDPINNTFVVPHLFGSKESKAYWKNFDWGAAIEAGMKYAELPYSGKYSFVETEYYFPTTHMVAPKEKALNCNECHSKNGRLKKLTGFYMPGRDSLQVLDVLGWSGVVAALLGVLIHGLLRIFYKKD